MTPRLLEAIMILKENTEWWSIETVKEVVDLKGTVMGWESADEEVGDDHELDAY